jgi:hypothetical protein
LECDLLVFSHVFLDAAIDPEIDSDGVVALREQPLISLSFDRIL